MNSKHILLCAVALFCGVNLNAQTAEEYEKEVNREQEDKEKQFCRCINACQAMHKLLIEQPGTFVLGVWDVDQLHKCLKQCQKKHLGFFETLEGSKDTLKEIKLAELAQKQAAAISAYKNVLSNAKRNTLAKAEEKPTQEAKQ
jgi:hypothetical protein